MGTNSITKQQTPLIHHPTPSPSLPPRASALEKQYIRIILAVVTCILTVSQVRCLARVPSCSVPLSPPILSSYSHPCHRSRVPLRGATRTTTPSSWQPSADKHILLNQSRSPKVNASPTRRPSLPQHTLPICDKYTRGYHLSPWSSYPISHERLP